MYTLFVTGAAAEQDHGVFQMDLARFLEFTDDALIAELKPISPEAVDQLMKWPCLLMEEGRSDEKARIGRITAAVQHRREVSLTFEPLSLPITNDDIWRLRRPLDIGEFEFHRNHIAVKERDLLGVLNSAGYDIGEATGAYFRVGGDSILSTPSRPQALPPPTRSEALDSRHPNRVFVVHGRNEAARSAVVAQLNDLGLEPIVLHDQPNMGRHLLTKFIEEAALVTFAVVVMTADDVGGTTEAQLAPRARQNVILELGYFIAHLGQASVCALITPGLETPSDFDGIVYIRMDDQERWRQELIRELRAAKLPIAADAADGTA